MQDESAPLANAARSEGELSRTKPQSLHPKNESWTQPAPNAKLSTLGRRLGAEIALNRSTQLRATSRCWRVLISVILCWWWLRGHCVGGSSTAITHRHNLRGR